MKLMLSFYRVAAVIFVTGPFGWSIARAECSSQKISIDAGSANAQVFTDLARYMLNGLSPDKSCREVASLQLECGSLIQEVCNVLLKDNSNVAYDVLRSFYQARHNETIDVRGHDAYVKSTVAEMRAITNYLNWERKVVPMSGIKRKTRVIYRSPDNFPAVFSVAETLDCTDGNLNAPKLETEVSIKRDDGSGSFEYYAYDLQGNLATSSQFPAGERPSPTVCVACHYNSQDGTVSRFVRQ